MAAALRGRHPAGACVVRDSRAAHAGYRHRATAERDARAAAPDTGNHASVVLVGARAARVAQVRRRASRPRTKVPANPTPPRLRVAGLRRGLAVALRAKAEAGTHVRSAVSSVIV